MSIDEKELPKQFGQYLLKQKIASGGMAELYLAEATGPGGFIKPLVIKMIHGAYVDDDRFLSMFTEEAKIVSSFTHGNIVPIFDFGRAAGRLYLAMEFIDGVDVATLMDVCRLQGLTLPVDIALFIGIGTAAGLSHAHGAQDSRGNSRSVVHRDVSPQNILLSRSGEVKLCDFGLAAPEVQSERSSQLDEEICGKLKYLSPEQATATGVDARSDIFSLGVVLYELLAGHHPVAFGTDITVLQELSGGVGYRSLSESSPWIEPSVGDVIDRAIAFDPDERFSSAEELRAALFRILHRDYPEFTPQDLSELVIRAQDATEEADEARDEESVARARLASFASSSRHRAEKIGETGQGSVRTAVKTRKRLVVGMAFIVVLSVFWVALLGKRPWEDMDKPAVTAPGGENILTKGRQGSRPNSVKTTRNRHRSKKPASNLTTGQNPKESKTSKSNSRDANAQKNQETTQASRAVSKRNRGFGTVNINASPWADVQIDGVDYTSTPILGLKLRPGKHKATFNNPELGVTKSQTFVVKSNETVRLVVDME